MAWQCWALAESACSPRRREARIHTAAGHTCTTLSHTTATHTHIYKWPVSARSGGLQAEGGARTRRLKAVGVHGIRFRP